MSETYTIGLDSWVGPSPLFDEGQVFTPRETHYLHFIDLQLRVGLLILYDPIQVYECDETGQPLGAPILWSTGYTFQKGVIIVPQRVRFRMHQTLLQADQLYLIVFRNRFPIPYMTDWGNDSTDQTYFPRGWRMSHIVGLPAWTPFYSQCHIFAEFGTPPLPKPKPEPPIEHFAIPTIEQTHIPDGVRIFIATTVPCHLTLYWTDKEPLKHHTSRTVRGLSVPWQTYFCFVAWQTVEQSEAGDTLYHTFDLTPWQACTIRWFTCRGEVDDIESPSVGPIFQKHYPGPAITEDFVCTENDGYLMNLHWSLNYQVAHDSPDGRAFDTQDTFRVGHHLTAVSYFIERTGLFFPTFTLPPDTKILSASLHFRAKQILGFGYDIVIVNGDDLSRPLLPEHYHDLLDDTTSLGSGPPISPWVWHEIQLNQLGLGKISKTDITKLALRTNKEIDAIPPALWEYTEIWSAESALKPFLRITHSTL